MQIDDLMKIEDIFNVRNSGNPKVCVHNYCVQEGGLISVQKLTKLNNLQTPNLRTRTMRIVNESQILILLLCSYYLHSDPTTWGS